MKAFIFSSVGQREQRCLPNPLAFSITRSMVPLLPSASGLIYPCAPKISFSSVVQPQEANTVVTSRNTINHIIHKLTIWGNKPSGGGGKHCTGCPHRCFVRITHISGCVCLSGRNKHIGMSRECFFYSAMGSFYQLRFFFLTGSEC